MAQDEFIIHASIELRQNMIYDRELSDALDSTTIVFVGFTNSESNASRYRAIAIAALEKQGGCGAALSLPSLIQVMHTNLLLK